MEKNVAKWSEHKELREKEHHYIWTWHENVNDILRFSLDTECTQVDTSNPDSGDVEAPDGPSRGS